MSYFVRVEDSPPIVRDRSDSALSDSFNRILPGGSADAQNETKPSVTVCREVSVPDQVRVDRCHRLPEYGPSILFFSGGSAIRDLSRILKHYTHNSVHLITPFDSGGSSAEIRRAFGMLSVGDLRNRLLALADDSALGNPEVADFFSHRLRSSEEEGQLSALEEFSSLLYEDHPLARAVTVPMRSILLSHLRWFRDRMPPDFDLRGASVGNLIITGCFLEHGRDIVTAIFLIWNLLGVRGTVRPLTGANLHIRTLYEDGVEEVGQHRLRKPGKDEARGWGGGDCDNRRGRKILKVDLVEYLQSPLSSHRQESRNCTVDPLSSEFIGTADLVRYCFREGRFCIR